MQGRFSSDKEFDALIKQFRQEVRKPVPDVSVLAAAQADPRFLNIGAEDMQKVVSSWLPLVSTWRI